MALTLTSPAFANGDRIPRKYTRDGENLSPPLKWTGAPDGTRSFALVVEDPDAPGGVFRHWAIFNMPADRDQLPQGAQTDPAAGAWRYGRNDFGDMRYDGPAPPHGHGAHHYHFRLAALDVPSLAVPPQAAAAAIWKEARKHALAEADLVGLYER